MTFPALYVLVRSSQREGSPFFVIKQGWLPFHAVVAVRAGRCLTFGELLPMRILVAVFAQSGGGLEIHTYQLGFKVRRFVAIDAGGSAVRSQQGKLGFGMVEAREFLPGFGRMAGLATQRTAVGPDLLHTLVELAVVDIFMATGAAKALPVVNDVRLRLKIGRLLMAVGAWHGDVPTGQHKARLLVFREGEGRGLVSLQVVASVARVEIGCCGKLPRMPVLMAVRACIKLHPVQRVLAFGYVALSALEACVTALKRILGRGVFLNGEERWFPTLDGVTRRTLASVRPFRELSLMGILVAIRALLEGYGLFEIPIRVALSTFNRKMFSFQRILCLGVVKLLVNALQ